MSTKKIKITSLETVYPPISASYRIDELAADLIRKSDFYMIGTRPLATFCGINKLDSMLLGQINVGQNRCVSFCIETNSLQTLSRLGKGEQFGVIEDTENHRFFEFRRVSDGILLDGYTPEKVLWEVARGVQGISASGDLKMANTFELLYVGIAKTGDNYKRLFQKGHKARMDILAKERPRLKHAVVSDEILLFLFKAKPLFFSTIGSDHDFDTDPEPWNTNSIDNKAVIVDAEKAFISLLKPEYNSIRYLNYPDGIDSLRSARLTSYLYRISEDFIFETPAGRFCGAKRSQIAEEYDQGDAICVNDGKVTVFRSSD